MKGEQLVDYKRFLIRVREIPSDAMVHDDAAVMSFILIPLLIKLTV